MATDQNIESITRNAAVDMSAANYLFTGVKLDTNGLATPVTSATDKSVGVLYGDPKVGKACQIVVAGVAKVKAGGTFAAGDQIGWNASGLAIKPAGASGTQLWGTALNSAVAGDVTAVLVDFGANPVA